MAHSVKGQGLTLDNVFAVYHKKIIIDGASFSVPTEKMTILAGINGCGKSTLLNTVAHISQPMGGSILFDGKVIHEQLTKALPRRLRILPQSPLLLEGLTVCELILRGRLPRQSFIYQWSDVDELTVEEALELAGTQEFAYLPAEKPSDGQHRCCQTAMVLARKTPCILLDEPITWLDLCYQVEIPELSRDLACHHGRIAVVVLHNLNSVVNYDDTLIFLRQGKVACVLNEGEYCTPELVKAVFDANIHASISPPTGKPRLTSSRSIERV